MVIVFSAIDNFRDLAESVDRRSRVCSKIIYRSATLDFATEDDITKLVSELNVNTILDLRSEVEAQTAKSCFVSFPVAAAVALKMKPSDMTDPNPEPSVVETTEGPTRKTIMINFAGQKFRKYAVWKAAPLKTKMQIVGLIASGQKPKAVKLVGEEIIAKKGLTGLYRDFVDYCDQEICEALHVLSDPTHYPVLIHCTQGKDRTGLVTALALAAAGIEEDKIIEDYAKSQEGLARVHDHMVKEMGKDGLDPSFADAPPEVMKKTFEYLREKYTDVNGYLDFIGFGEKEREVLRKALTLTHPKSPQPQSHAIRKASDGATLHRNSSPMRANARERGNSSERSDSPARSYTPDSDSPAQSDRKHSRSRNVSTSSATSDTDSGYGSGGAWSPSPNTRERPIRPLGTSIGGARREPMTLKYLIANPRAGVEMLGAGLGILPLAEDKHHRRNESTSSSDGISDTADKEDGYLPHKLFTKSPFGNGYSPVSTSSPNLKGSTPIISSSPFADSCDSSPEEEPPNPLSVSSPAISPPSSNPDN